MVGSQRIPRFVQVAKAPHHRAMVGHDAVDLCCGQPVAPAAALALTEKRSVLPGRSLKPFSASCCDSTLKSLKRTAFSTRAGSVGSCRKRAAWVKVAIGSASMSS